MQDEVDGVVAGGLQAPQAVLQPETGVDQRLAARLARQAVGCILSLWHLRHLRICGSGNRDPSQRNDDVVSIYPSLGGD